MTVTILYAQRQQDTEKKMELLIAGLSMWTLVHLIPSIAQPLKQNWIKLLGQRGYTISFSVLILTSLVLIVFGWRNTTPFNLYVLPEITYPIAIALIIIAFVLFGAAKHPTRIKRVVRHPQLMSVIVWSSGHLLINGDSRSVLLFGWLGCWAILEIIFINRREGEWVKQPSPSWNQEFKGLAISLVIFAVAVIAHPYISGVALF